MRTVIKIENLGKKYLIRHQPHERYISLRDVITDKFKFIAKKIFKPKIHEVSFTNSTKEEFWALKGVSCEVKKGDKIGIIGRNGAGKTTLLKIISRITEPTTGKIQIKGRVASLLEVGAGFHPELNGRENIYLNGALLGMSNSEIKKKFDEIVTFAEVEKFLDTPVKRYSSGMYIRLAFAVAAHLEPEILLVDEVLAVGDMAFQEKCLGKMEEVTKQGRTVLLVSHNMAHIQSLTTWTVVLKQGMVDFIGKTDEAIHRYVSLCHKRDSKLLLDRTDRTGVSPGTLQAIRLSINSRPVDGIAIAGMPLEIELDYHIKFKGKLDFFVAFYDMFERRIVHINSIQSGMNGIISQGKGTVRCIIHKLPLAPGKYSLAVAIDQNGENLDRIEHACHITVNMGNFFGTGQTTGSDWGMFLVESRWQTL